MALYFVLLISFGLSAHAFATNLCSKINVCQVKKITFRTSGWVTEYEKQLRPQNLCLRQSDPSHILSVEPELGISLQVFDGNPSAQEPVGRQPYLAVDVFTYKLTFVVASLKEPLKTSDFSFSHRLVPNENSLITVECRR